MAALLCKSFLQSLSKKWAIFFLRHSLLLIITDPLPPGPIDSNTSNFHPQTLFLRWPKNNYKEAWYRIIMNGYSEYVYSTEIQWSRPLEPDTSYPVHITVFCWYKRSYSKRSSYTGHIQTLRKWNMFYILSSIIFFIEYSKK